MTISAKTGEVTFDGEPPQVKAEDAFNDELQRLVYASESGDGEMVEAVAVELRRLYREANRGAA